MLFGCSWEIWWHSQPVVVSHFPQEGVNAHLCTLILSLWQTKNTATVQHGRQLNYIGGYLWVVLYTAEMRWRQRQDPKPPAWIAVPKSQKLGAQCTSYRKLSSLQTIPPGMHNWFDLLGVLNLSLFLPFTLAGLLSLGHLPCLSVTYLPLLWIHD